MSGTSGSPWSGTGPLLLPVAAALRHAGADLRLVAEQAPAGAVLAFAGALWRTPGRLVQAAAYRAAFAGVRYRWGTWVTRVDAVEGELHATYTDGRSTWAEPIDLLCAAAGLVPSTELARLIGCGIDGGNVVVDDAQRTTVAGVYAAGEPTGNTGVEAALVEGTIAGLAAAGREAARPSGTFRAERDRHRRFAAVPPAHSASARNCAIASSPIPSSAAVRTCRARRSSRRGAHDRPSSPLGRGWAVARAGSVVRRCSTCSATPRTPSGCRWCPPPSASWPTSAHPGTTPKEQPDEAVRLDRRLPRDHHPVSRRRRRGRDVPRHAREVAARRRLSRRRRPRFAGRGGDAHLRREAPGPADLSHRHRRPRARWSRPSADSAPPSA